MLGPLVERPAQVPLALGRPVHADAVRAEAVPVADDRDVTGLAEGDREVRVAAGEGVVQVPRAPAEHADAVDAVAVPVAHDGDVAGCCRSGSRGRGAGLRRCRR